MQKINNIVAKFQNDEEFKRWGITLQMTMPDVEGYKLPPPTIQNNKRMDDFYNRRERHL